MILGFGHKARQGKDSAGEYLAENYGFKVYRFSDALKQEVTAIGWTPENKNEKIKDLWERWTKEGIELNQLQQDVMKFWNELTLEERQAGMELSLLQWYGTNYRRSQDPDYWIKALEKQIEEDDENLIAICDMRFISEMNFIENGTMDEGYTIDVQRFVNQQVLDFETGLPTRVQVRYIDKERDPNHPSESELDCMPHDYTLQHVTLEQLYRQLDSMMMILGVEKKVCEPSTN